MEVATLFSGSSGNCIYVGTENTKVLVDAGFSGKKIVQALSNMDIDIREIKALLVTHEHIDHIRGLGVLSRRYNIPIYASPKTWSKLACIGEIQEHNRREYEYGMEIGDLKLEFFKTHHDAVQPLGIAFYHQDSLVGIATDTGCITTSIRKALTGANALVFESNYDENMLKEGPYPYYLKKRISGNKGHLSNKDAAKELGEIISGSTEHVILAHLSEVNNTPEIAYSSVKEILQDNGINDRVKLSVAPRYEVHETVKIKRI
ncbi:MAG: MBL fold metallo-hydrolase [Bacillota bacterium]|jgi:phosphoribosyl 1,2-cyclic phosphodiesterase